MAAGVAWHPPLDRWAPKVCHKTIKICVKTPRGSLTMKKSCDWWGVQSGQVDVGVGERKRQVCGLMRRPLQGILCVCVCWREREMPFESWGVHSSKACLPGARRNITCQAFGVLLSWRSLFVYTYPDPLNCCVALGRLSCIYVYIWIHGYIYI